MKILLLGEGDFSFSHSIAVLARGGNLDFISKVCKDQKPIIPPELVATSLDSRQEILEKYPAFVHYEKFEKVSIHHSVNAFDGRKLRDLVESPSIVIWNHPHLGTENCERHYQLLVHFFHTVKSIFPSATVVVSLLADQILRWRVTEAAKLYRLTCMFPFNEAEFPGYSCRRNLGGDSFKSARTRANWDGASLKSHFLVFSSSGEDSVDVQDYLQKNSVVEKKLTCEKCKSEFASEQGLRTHVRQVHELGLYRTGEFKCDQCERWFKTAESLRMHCLNGHKVTENKRQKLDAESASYKCDLCGSTETNHVEQFGRNREQRVVTCDVCGKEFKSDRALSQHKNVVHS